MKFLLATTQKLTPLSFTFPTHIPHKSVLSLSLDSCHLAGADMDVCLTNYGHCNYVSGKHACIFYDEVRGRDGWEGAFLA